MTVVYYLRFGTSNAAGSCQRDETRPCSDANNTLRVYGVVKPIVHLLIDVKNSTRHGRDNSPGHTSPYKRKH